MKKFFEDIKKDIKFKSAGPGKKLTEDTRLKEKLLKIALATVSCLNQLNHYLNY